MYSMVVIGFSAGGQKFAQQILSALPSDFVLPIVMVGHIPESGQSLLPQVLDNQVKLKVLAAVDKQILKPGHVYIAPPGYHTLLETQNQLALSVDEPVQFVRPSIDILFESAAQATNGKVICIALSGANSDGVQGMAYCKAMGGVTVVQDPAECPFKALPHAAIDNVDVDYVLGIEDIISNLLAIGE